METYPDSGPERLSWAATVLGLVLFVGVTVLARTATCHTLGAAVISSGVLVLMGLVAAGRARFARRQYEEEVQVREYREEHAGSDLFEGTDEALQVAARANKAYVRVFVPAFTVLLGAGLFALAYFLWKKWAGSEITPLPFRALRYAALAAGLFLYSILCGAYFVGVSREPYHRWLRPCGAWFFLTAAFLAVAVITLIAIAFHIGGDLVDVRVGRVLMLVLMALGVELLIGFIVEFYRPRSLREEERPLYESRLLALFTEPGGIARNVSASLDYQFGFQVSEAWFYRFLERAVLPLFLLMVVGMWLLTTIVVVRPDEQGVREWFGAVLRKDPLEPGLYFKLPWPFGRIYKFPVTRIQQIPVGYVPGGEKEPEEELTPEEEALQGDMTGRVIVWAKRHNRKEIPFIVASRPDATSGSESGEPTLGDMPVAVYYMSASIPVFFKVTDLYRYAYMHRNANKELEELATREVVRYLANVDFFDILTHGRASGGEELRERIQAAADRHELGIRIVFVGLQGLHPPVEVGKYFDDVVGAMEERHSLALEAESYSIRKVRDAEASGLDKVSQAKAYRNDRISVPKAEAERFQEQLTAYRAAPNLYVLRTFLDMLESEAPQMRMYLLSDRSSQRVIMFDLKQKLRPDLLDLNLEEESGAGRESK